MDGLTDGRVFAGQRIAEPGWLAFCSLDMIFFFFASREIATWSPKGYTAGNCCGMDGDRGWADDAKS